MTLGSVALQKPIVEIFGICGIFNFAIGSLVVKGKDSQKLKAFSVKSLYSRVNQFPALDLSF